MSSALAFATEATALGFVKTKYLAVERERRWLCDALPSCEFAAAEAITDLYVDGTALRLREARPMDGGPTLRRLTKKADLSPDKRLITSIYLSKAEYDLFQPLPGKLIHKVRHRLPSGLSVDVFAGALEGLITAEMEFDTDEAMAGFERPEFAVREITADTRFSGGWLARHGRPPF